MPRLPMLMDFKDAVALTVMMNLIVCPMMFLNASSTCSFPEPRDTSINPTRR